MKILAIGDVVGKAGVEFLKKNLKDLKRAHGIDLCIANGENAANGNGVTRESADGLLSAGVDVITLGNHAFQKNDVYALFDEDYPLIRPLNFPPNTPGSGYICLEVGSDTVCVANLMGRVHLDNLDCPFRAADALLKTVQSQANIAVVDFHAEATSEKIAMGHYLDGRVGAMFGTHTHVPTADERILPGGTAYITDIGMTGPEDSVLGVKKEIIMKKFVTQIHQRFELSENPIRLCGVVITLGGGTGMAEEIRRITVV